MASSLPFSVKNIKQTKNLIAGLLATEEWISDKNPVYPIDLEIFLGFPCDVERIEIVSHNHFTPSRLELLVKDQQNITPIGEVYFKPRREDKHELKTIHIDARFSTLILRIHECQTKGNTYHQIGISELKIYGSPDNSTARPFSSNKKLVEGDGKFTKELLEVAKIVQANKQKCVKEENFQMAKQAQTAEKLLQKAIKEMKEIEHSKDIAAAVEDYQKAADLSAEIQRLRAHVLASIDARLISEITVKQEKTVKYMEKAAPLTDDLPTSPEHLFDETRNQLERPRVVTPTTVSSASSGSREKKPQSIASAATNKLLLHPFPIFLRSETLKPPPAAVTERVADRSVSRKSMRSRPSSVESSKVTNKTGTLNKFQQKENMVLPAVLKRKSVSVEPASVEIQSDSPSKEEEVAQKSGTKHASRILGEHTIKKINSGNTSQRREGIKEAKAAMQMANAKNARDILEAIIFVLSRTLEDSQNSIYEDSLDLLRSCVVDFMPKRNLLNFSSKLADSTAEPLLSKLDSSSDKKLAKTTQKTLQDVIFSHAKIAKGYIPHLLATSSIENRFSAERAELISAVIDHYDIPNEQAGLKEDSLRRYTIKCLTSSNSETRLHGKRLILRIYDKGNRQEVRDALRLNESRRPSLIREIAREMDVLDGRT